MVLAIRLCVFEYAQFTHTRDSNCYKSRALIWQVSLDSILNEFGAILIGFGCVNENRM